MLYYNEILPDYELNKICDDISAKSIFDEQISKIIPSKLSEKFWNNLKTTLVNKFELPIKVRNISYEDIKTNKYHHYGDKEFYSIECDITESISDNFLNRLFSKLFVNIKLRRFYNIFNDITICADIDFSYSHPNGGSNGYSVGIIWFDNFDNVIKIIENKREDAL